MLGTALQSPQPTATEANMALDLDALIDKRAKELKQEREEKKRKTFRTKDKGTGGPRKGSMHESSPLGTYHKTVLNWRPSYTKLIILHCTCKSCGHVHEIPNRHLLYGYHNAKRPKDIWETKEHLYDALHFQFLPRIIQYAESRVDACQHCFNQTQTVETTAVEVMTDGFGLTLPQPHDEGGPAQSEPEPESDDGMNDRDPDENLDPVHQHDGQWYFWDETWRERVGPYDSEDQANQALGAYLTTLDSENFYA